MKQVALSKVWASVRNYWTQYDVWSGSFTL